MDALEFDMRASFCYALYGSYAREALSPQDSDKSGRDWLWQGTPTRLVRWRPCIEG